MDFAIIEEKTVVSLPKEFFFRYFGWPTVARFADGRLVLAASCKNQECAQNQRQKSV